MTRTDLLPDSLLQTMLTDPVHLGVEAPPTRVGEPLVEAASNAPR